MPETNQSGEPVRRHRSRRRATAQQGPPAAATAAAAEPTPAESSPSSDSRPAAAKGRRSAATGRGDRDLAGAGLSQVGPTGAMRARDLNRPTARDLAQAEAELTIVRRNWTPVADAPPQRGHHQP